MNRNDIITLAKQELGYLEKSAAAYKADKTVLDRKTDGSGTDNYTKYARDVKHAQAQPWCETFIHYLFAMCYGRENADKLLCGKLSSASTIDTKNAFSEAGRLVALDKAQAGDLVWRSRNGGGHVGLVIGRTSSGGVVTIEGNTDADTSSWNGGMVAQHSNATWKWCGRPDWSIIEAVLKPNTWYKQPDGRWKYAVTSTSYETSKWRIINGHKYYFDADGYAVTGKQKIDGKVYLFATLDESVDFECALMRTDADGVQHVWDV